MITDPMHTILLGMVHNEIKLIIHVSTLTVNQLSEFYSRIKAVKIPYDLGRLPINLNGDSLAGLTAQQWKNFACIYARPCLVGLLEGRAYKSLCLLCEIVELIVKPVITRDEIATLYRLLNEHHKQFAKVYGKREVTINYHMGLHIADVVSDYGPPHVYWCFAYERMNGILTGTPNSKRNIEPQILRNILQQFTYASEFYDLAVPSGIDVCMPKALKNIHVVPVERLLYPDSYSVLALLIQPEGQDRFAFQRAIDQGDVQDWPIRMQHPSKCNVRVDEDFYQQIVEFCNNTYDGDVYVKHQIDKYGRCSVNGQTFSSDSDRGSIVKAMFVLKDNGNLHPYTLEL